MHKLIVDPSHNLLEARLSGCIDVAEAVTFVSDLSGHLGSGKLRPGHLLLVDVSECAIQAQATVAALHAKSRHLPPASRIAVVTGCSVVRIQARRIMKQAYARLFGDRASALVWLLSRDGDAPAPARPVAMTARAAGG